jgi:DNA-binding winged helix-turn-helix (wHTH) protein
METTATLYRFGTFTLDPFRRVVLCGDQLVALTPKAVDVLVALVERAGRLVTKAELMEQVWPETFVEEANLSVQMSALRKALGKQADGREYVETVPRRGYRFVASAERKAASLPRSLAVLPWRALHLGPEEEYLGVVMADALITRVGALGQLLVRPTAAVTRYASGERELSRIARELGVDVVLDGSLQRVGSRLRATAQLVRASDGATLWAGQFEPEATDLLAVQDAIAEPIMRALLLHVGQGEAARLSRQVSLNPQAYQAFLRGRYFWNKLTGHWLLKALAAFGEASAQDPGYAPAHVGRANTYVVLGLLGEMPPQDAWACAGDAGRRALECDQSSAEAHVALGYARLFASWDWADAERGDGGAHDRSALANREYRAGLSVLPLLALGGADRAAPTHVGA